MQVSKPETFEISQTMKFRRAGWSLCFIVFFGIVLYFSLVVIPSMENNFWGATTSALLILLVGGMSLIGVLYVLWIYRGASKLRVFSISPEGIKIEVPRKPIFELGWSKFDLIHLHKFSGSSNQKYYKFYFLSNGVVCDEFTIEGSIHFSGSNCRTIVARLKQYAEIMNVQFVRGNRIKY